MERILAGEAAIDEGRWRDADRAFRQVAEADPRSAIARVGLARVALGIGRWEDARARLDEALAIDPEDALARRLRAELDARMPGPAAGAAGAAPVERPAARRSLLARLLGRRS